MYADNFGLFVRDNVREYRPAAREEIVSTARLFLDTSFKRDAQFNGPDDSKNFVSVRLGPLPHEVFCVAFLDAHLRVIEFREMFRGTLTKASVYPREVVKEALQLNAAAVILSHNHPSGVPEPSQADTLLTDSLKAALALVDVRVIDQLVVGRGQVVSFAERGLL